MDSAEHLPAVHPAGSMISDLQRLQQHVRESLSI